jgi:UDP-N-acetylmuramyl pentapeptide phosphotransferase/UDP-N-acetylglucosamine-1-phosphate transferase
VIALGRRSQYPDAGIEKQGLMMQGLWGIACISGIISLGAVGLVRHRFRQQLLDIPNERSAHTEPTPRGGGVGFIFAFAIAHGLAVLLRLLPSRSLMLWLVLIPLAFTGFLDDKYNLSAKTRYLVQLGASGLAVGLYGAFPQPWFSDGDILGQSLAIVLTVIGMTAIINFYNFMDGLDGLVAGCTALQLGFWAIYLHQPLNGLLVAALIGFLYWNWSPAKIFMGDVGSTVLGAMAAIALLTQTGDTTTAWSALTLTLPLIGDAIYTLCYRLWRRENIFQAHRCHIFQRLQQVGWHHTQVTLLYMGLTGLLAIAVGLAHPWWGVAMILGGIAIAHWTLPMPPIMARPQPEGTETELASSR